MSAVQKVEAAAAERNSERRMSAPKAGTWAVSSRLGAQLIRFAAATVLARLLTPSEFGVVAMGVTLSGFVTVLTDSGVRSAVVQFRDLDDSGLSTAFWASAGFGAVLALGLVWASHPLATFARMPGIGPVIAILAVGLLVGPLGAVPLGLLNRRMEFHKSAAAEVCAELIAGILAVTLAFRGAGYWALVIQSLTATTIATSLYFAGARWSPRFAFRRSEFMRIVHFSGQLTGFNSVNYWARNLDNILIGRFFGSRSLGYYSRAYSLMMYPFFMLQGAISPVLHTALSAMQDDDSRMRAAYLRFAKMTLMVSVPGAVVLALLAKPLILTVLGSQWQPAVPIFQALCAVTAIQPLYGASAAVYLSRTRADLYLRLGGVYVIAVSLGIVLGLRWGPLGVAVGYGVANYVTIPPMLSFIVRRLLGGKNQDLLRQTKTPLVCTLVAGIAVAFWTAGAASHVSAAVSLVVGLVIAATAVLGTVALFDFSFLKESQELLPTPLRRYFCHD